MSTITEILVVQGDVTPEQAEESRRKFRNQISVDRDFVERGLITEFQYAKALAFSLGTRFVDLNDLQLDAASVALIPSSLARRHKILPVGMKDGHLQLAMVDPRNVLALDDVLSVVGKPVDPVVAARDAMQVALDRYARSDDEISTLSASMEETVAEQVVDVSVDESDASAPIVKFVNLIVTQAISDRASDIHIEPGPTELRVRYRIDGVLHDMQHANRNIQDGVISRLKIMSDMDIAERRKPQDGRMSVDYENRRIDLRVATLPTVWGEKIVLRILDNSTTNLSLHDLAMSDANYLSFERSFTKPHGMILVTGPTGSGKSTTLYTTLHAISKPEVNVITVEDPVEYRLPNINQVQVNPKAGLTFAGALRSILRSDPDVILVGEIRDHETAQVSIEASLTGHLVLSTLHTNDAPSAITRLTDMGIEPFLVGSSIDCVVAQRLARKLCDRCKERYVEDPALLTRIGFPPLDSRRAPLYRPVGCTACSNTGYRGRIAVHEVMTVSEPIEKLAVARASSMDLRTQAVRDGMIGLREDGWAKVAAGLTSIEEVLRVVV